MEWAWPHPGGLTCSNAVPCPTLLPTLVCFLLLLHLPQKPPELTDIPLKVTFYNPDHARSKRGAA